MASADAIRRQRGAVASTFRGGLFNSSAHSRSTIPYKTMSVWQMDGVAEVHVSI
jgi:hypothetical protein